MSTVYLDHAATAPLRPEAGEEFLRVAQTLGNASAIHGYGRSARRVVDEARETIADLLGADPHEVIFTSGGTEADNLAIQGGWLASRAQRPRLIVSEMEHSAVIETAHWLAAHHGAKVDKARVAKTGVVDVEALTSHLDTYGSQVGLISIMWANNETGVVQPIPEIVERARQHGIAVHSDAVQAAGWLRVDFRSSGLDALSISGHKFGAPVGVGALVASREFTILPHMHGGLQERGVRSGTVNGAGVAALATALRLAVEDQQVHTQRVEQLRDELQAGIQRLAPQSVVWGQGQDRLPGHLLVSIPGTRSEAVLFALDMAGIAASAGSACQAGVVGASPVVLALGGSEEEAMSALRFTLGAQTTQDDIDYTLHKLSSALEQAQTAFAVNP